MYGRDGALLGRVTRLLGDPGRDIFDGIAFRAGLFAPEHAAPLADIERITERAIMVRLAAGEAGPPAPPPGLGPVRRRRWRDEEDD